MRWEFIPIGYGGCTNMMMAQVMDQKRRSSDFLHLKCEGEHGRGNGMESKRLKTGGCGRGSISVRERKDKVGEKISALQQLVSPFGKTDTASVLQETTEYIKFLHEQLEVLSAPYLKNPSTSTAVSQQMSEHRNLRSRGLCLVPVSYSLQLSGNNGADIWAPVDMKKP